MGFSFKPKEGIKIYKNMIDEIADDHKKEVNKDIDQTQKNYLEILFLSTVYPYVKILKKHVKIHISTCSIVE